MPRPLLLALALMAVLLIGATYALTAANTVPPTRAGVTVDPLSPDGVKANKLKPPECASLSLQRVVIIGVHTPNNQNELILGTSGNNSINALGGHDCVLAGGGNDIVRGWSGNDVLLGGPGNDSLFGGSGNDSLIGGPGNDYCRGWTGNDTFNDCETIVDP